MKEINITWVKMQITATIMRTASSALMTKLKETLYFHVYSYSYQLNREVIKNYCYLKI